MALLEIDRIKKDIQWLYYNMRCLLNKSALESPITATEWSSNHSLVTYNQYQIGTFVWYQGNIYECIAANDGLPVTAALYWKLIGPGHLLQEEQSDWDATGGRSAIRNKPTSTSEFINDGEDGGSPFATLNDLPMLQDLESVLTAGDTAEDKDANIKELGLYDDYQSNVVTPGFAKVFAENFKLWFQDKTGINLFYIGYGVVRFFKGIYTFNISTPNLTGNRTATFQDASGVVAYLSDVTSSVEVSYQVAGGTSGNPPVFNGTPMFTGSYVITGPLVHFQIQVDMDNITNFGTGQYYVKLPFTSKYGYMFRTGCLHDFSTGREYHISGHVFAGLDTMELFTSDTQGNNLYDFPFTSTEPVALNAADNFHIAGTYISDFTSN